MTERRRNQAPDCASRHALPAMALITVGYGNSFESDAQDAASDSQELFKHLQAFAFGGWVTNRAGAREAPL